MPRKEKGKAKHKPMPAPPREPWEINAQIVRDVAEAIERVINELPEGGSIDRVWQTIETFKVDRVLFDRALWVLKTQRRVRRIKDRLYPAEPARRRSK